MDEIQNPINCIKFIDQLFDESLQLWKEANCFSFNNSYNGRQVMSLISFLKFSMISLLKDKIKTSKASKKLIDGNNFSINDIDIDDIADSISEIIYEDNMNENSDSTNSTKNINKIERKTETNSESIKLPNIEKILTRNHSSSNDLNLECDIMPQETEKENQINSNDLNNSGDKESLDKNLSDINENCSSDHIIENDDKLIDPQHNLDYNENIEDLFDPVKRDTKNDSDEQIKQSCNIENVNNNSDTNKSSDNDLDESDKSNKKTKQNSYLKKINNLIKSDSSTSDNDEMKKRKSENKIKKMKKRRKIIVDSDTEKGISSNESLSPMLETSSDDSMDIKKTKKLKRRKRIQVITSSEDEKDTRKKIHKVMSKDRLSSETRNAEKAERERRKRIEEKQKFYESINQEFIPISSNIERVILDIDQSTKEVLVEVDKKIVSVLKPHQVDGIKFIYNCTIETVHRLNNNDHQSGCILAHSMGLGKTLQVVAFLQTVMNNSYTKDKIHKVLIIVPLNVARNWADEFRKWSEECKIKNEIKIYEMIMVKTIKDRGTCISNWYENGGILIITINLFTQLIGNKKDKKARSNLRLEEYLLDPGPDMVIVDEGHLLKNDKTWFNICVNKIKTLRRVILTGTPLQNNLSEYYIMVDFVKPNLLGHKKEFKNRFENPIINGQHVDSTAADVKLMKKSVHILHRLLKDVIHRCSYDVLVPYLKPKFEYVIKIRLTQKQTDLYRYYLDNLTNKSAKNLLYDYSILRLIWNHPAALIDFYRNKNEKEDDFIVNDSEESNLTKESSSEIEILNDILPASPKSLRSRGKAPELTLDDLKLSKIENNWWQTFFKEDEAICVEISTKFILLLWIIEQNQKNGEKTLVFSQSLAILDLIEDILEMKNDETNEKFGQHLTYDDLQKFQTGGIIHRWCKNIDYFRIDGKIKCDDRYNMIDHFNDEDNPRARLMLLSTKAGGLGINLIGANRCIIFDVSWNPSHDLQAIYRIFRYGQKRPVFIYRFISFGTMENKIYDRQIIKQSLAGRVIDEQQINRHFRQADLLALYDFTEPEEKQAILSVPKDTLLADMLLEFKNLIISYHEHDSLLENCPDEDLTEEERKSAWADYERSKEEDNNLENGKIPTIINTNNFQNNYINTIQSTSTDEAIYQPKGMSPGQDYIYFSHSLDVVLDVLQKVPLNPMKFVNMTLPKLALAYEQLISNPKINYVYKFLTFIACLERKFSDMKFIQIATQISSIRKTFVTYNKIEYLDTILNCVFTKKLPPPIYFYSNVDPFAQKTTSILQKPITSSSQQIELINLEDSDE